MPYSEEYRRQVELLVRMLPYIAEEESIALKGGTAINLFIRDMPRLSVDIDLTYLPVAPRAQSLAGIDAAMRRIWENTQSVSPAEDVTPHALNGEDVITRLTARGDGVQIKVEVTPVLRGCVFDPVTRTVTQRVEDEFGFAEMKVVSFADLYAGKIVAALDRQHPRDLFDIKDLLANEGIGENLRRAFIVYLLSHNRPMSEVLAPTRKDISHDFVHGFAGMTEKPVALDELLDAREQLIAAITGDMPEAHRQFLLSFERGDPDWALLGLDGVASLPAVQWRQQNLDKLPAKRRAALVEGLEAVLWPNGSVRS